MKRIVILITAAALTCASANAQSLLERLGNRAKNALEQNVGNKVEKGVNDVLDGKVGKKDKKNNQNNNQTQTTQQSNTASAAADGTWTCQNPECGHAGNTVKFCEECGTKKPTNSGVASAESAPVAKPQTQTTYAKSDFVPGDEIIFDDTLDGEQMGEFPSMWELLGGESQVLEINGKKCIALQHDGDCISPLMKNPRNFLGDVFTVEFDVFFTGTSEGTLNWVFLPADSDKEPVFTLEMPVVENDKESYSFRWWWKTGTGDKEGEKPGVVITSGAWHHMALSFNKRALKYYLDGERLINLPNVSVVPGWFTLGSVFEPSIGITNIRIAKGAVPLYDRLASEGKIITYAITFDTGKATLKPEADVEINRIKELMVKDASLKFEVQGHCDNTGSDAVNDPLSQKRAEAIVARLVEMGISKDRLTAVGKGSHEPIADNSTDEGRAKNRRVEFVKK